MKKDSDWVQTTPTITDDMMDTIETSVDVALRISLLTLRANNEAIVQTDKQ